MTVATKTQTIISFLFNTQEQLYLRVELIWNNKNVDLSLAAFMQFLYQHEDHLSKSESEFCYALARLVKKVDFKGNLIYAIPNDYDMALFFKRAMHANLSVLWRDHNDDIRPISFDDPLPITILVKQKGPRLCCELINREEWIKNPLMWLRFQDDKHNYYFSKGVIKRGIKRGFENFIDKFLDKDQLYYGGDHILAFINQLYTPNKQVIQWKIQVDFLSFLPKETTPVGVLKIGYTPPILTSNLFFRYENAEIAPDFKEKTVLDKRTGKKHQRMMDMESIYQQDLMSLFEEFNLPFLLQSPGDIAKFMDKVMPTLKDRGWIVKSDVPEFNVLEDPVELEFSIGSSDKNWFHFEPNCNVSGQNMSLQEVAALMVQNQGYVKTSNGFAKISERSQKELAALTKMGALKTGKEFSRAEILPLIAASNARGTNENSTNIVEQLNNSDPSKGTFAGKSFKGELRDYQQFGLNWMGFLAQSGLGGILADDMGLGKTCQTIALSTTLKGEGPVLVVGPTNVIYNWESEIKKFAPSLTSIVYTGAGREKKIKKLPFTNFVITTYGILKNDLEVFTNLKPKAIFIDEAQYIKNPKAQISKAIKCIESPFKVAMTGTPVENHLQDLWNLFDFAMPGYLGTLKQFDMDVKDGHLDVLRMKIKPFVLRREKREVLTSLPEKTEITLKCPLSDEQEQLYKTVLTATRKGIREGGKQNKLNMLTALLKLRQVCIHPGLLKEFEGSNIPSSKFELVKEKLTELVAEKHKIVIFTQFTKMLDIMQKWLKKEGIYNERIDGSVSAKARKTAIDRFQESEKAGVFLVSLKAGGVGINLTAADYVIHLDPWWNPAVEAQATDRVHRMGQLNKVIVYKMISEGTIEEKIQELQDEKRALLSQVIDIDSSNAKAIDIDEVRSLLFD